MNVQTLSEPTRSRKSAIGRISPGKVQVRRLATIGGCAVLSGTMMLAVPGCSTIPNRDDTIRTIDGHLDALGKWRQQEIKNCNGDAACIEAIEKLYRELADAAWKLRLQVINEQWQDARESKKKLEEKLRDLIPAWPGLKEFLDEIIRFGGEAPADIAISGVSGTGSSGTVLSPGTGSTAGSKTPVPAPISISYEVSGLVDMGDWYVGDEFGIQGNLSVTGQPLSGGGFEGVISSGSFTMTLPQGMQVGATVLPPNEIANLAGTLSVDAAGAGVIYLVLEVPEQILDQHPQWGVVIGSLTSLRLPVQMDGSQNLTVTYSGPLNEMFPPAAWPASDYDGDGVLDPNADFEAFSAGFLAGDPLADSNADGLWTSEDVSLWQARFTQDYQNQ